jgi:MFS transporter, AAHS family, 4-hydroxybenzoate transporter
MNVDRPSSGNTEPSSPGLERAVAERIDASTMGTVQLRILFLCMSLSCLDGYDIASMGLAVPLIAREWNISPGSFGGALAAVMGGSAIGGFTLGWLGDRIGRRPMVISSAIGIGLASIGSMWADNVTQMIAWRFLIGIAFGTGLPNVYALVGESVPSRHRTFCSTLLAASASVGGIASGLAAPTLSSWLGWKGIFLSGGLVTLLIALLMLFLLGESPQVLAARARVRELVAALADFGLDNTNLPEHRPAHKWRGGGPLSLVRDGLFPISFFYLLGYISCGFAYYLLSNWLPALLTHSGWPSSSAQRSIAIVFGGSMVGGLSLSWIMDRLQRGSLFVPAIVFTFGAVLFVPVGYLLTSSLVLPLLGALAFVIGGGQYVLPALAVRLFPPSVLATALSWIFPLSRVGGFFGSLAGGWMLLSGWSGSRIMMVLGLAPLLSAIAFAALSVAVTQRQKTQIEAAGFVRTEISAG